MVIRTDQTFLLTFVQPGGTLLKSSGVTLVPSMWWSPLVCSPPLRRHLYVLGCTNSTLQFWSCDLLLAEKLWTICDVCAGSLEGWCQESHHLCTQRWCTHVCHGCQPWEVWQIPPRCQVRLARTLASEIWKILPLFWKSSVNWCCTFAS